MVHTKTLHNPLQIKCLTWKDWNMDDDATTDADPVVISGYRMLTAALPDPLVEMLRIAVRSTGASLGAVITDAVDAMAAVLATGGEVPAVPVGDSEDVLLRVPLSMWAMDCLDGLIGSRPQFADRATVVRAALTLHLMGSEGVLPLLTLGVGLWGTSGGRRGQGDDRGPLANADVQSFQRVWGQDVGVVPAPRIGAGPGAPGMYRARSDPEREARMTARALSRLEAFATSRPMGSTPLDLAVLLAPVPADDVLAIAPEGVRIGLDHETARLADGMDGFAALSSERYQEPDRDVYGLTNRVTPTLWAASQLVKLQVAAGGHEVGYGDFMSYVMPHAWRIGIGLERWEGDHGMEGGSQVRLYRSSARWPSRPTDATDPDRARRREASTAYGFVEYALLTWTRAGRGSSRAGWARGPLAALGLVQARADADGAVWLSATGPAVRLLSELADAHTSCAYPHSGEAWHAYKSFLLDANPDELNQMNWVLNAVAVSRSRDEIARQASSIGDTGDKVSSKSLTHANGYVARLREWGLLQLARPKFGMKALTPLGLQEMGDAQASGPAMHRSPEDSVGA